MTFGQWLVTGLEGALFIYGLISYFGTKNTAELGGAAIFMILVAGVYGLFS